MMTAKGRVDASLQQKIERFDRIKKSMPGFDLHALANDKQGQPRQDIEIHHREIDQVRGNPQRAAGSKPNVWAETTTGCSSSGAGGCSHWTLYDNEEQRRPTFLAAASGKSG